MVRILYNISKEEFNRKLNLKDFLEITIDSKLDPREQNVVRRRFGMLEGCYGLYETQEEIGEGFGVGGENITRERIREIEERAIKKLKPFLAREMYEKGLISYDKLSSLKY